MAGMEIEFEFYDHQTNETISFRGTIDGLASEIQRVLTSNTTSSGNTTEDTSGDMTPYDYRGALWFVVTVILVYSLSMFMIVVTLARRKSANKNIDVEVERYIKGVEAARKRAREENVLRMRLQWPGNFIWLRFTNKTERERERESRENVDSESDSDIEEDSESSGSYIELPATTVNGSNAECVIAKTVSKATCRTEPLPTRGGSRRSAMFVHADDVALPPSARPIMETINETPPRCSLHKVSPEYAAVHLDDALAAEPSQETHSAKERRSHWGMARPTAVEESLPTAGRMKHHMDVHGVSPLKRDVSVPPRKQNVQVRAVTGTSSAAGGANIDTMPHWKRKPLYLSSEEFHSQDIASKKKKVPTATLR